MFEIVIEAEGFRGKRIVQQHKMVNDVSWGDTHMITHGGGGV